MKVLYFNFCLFNVDTFDVAYNRFDLPVFLIIPFNLELFSVVNGLSAKLRLPS